ncbi:MAG: anhydro-N-acetylmuramic acid kinase [Chitinophagales bacterium]|nr:anhydro-N-acetylmuramic acid kinase [Chitinophagales bacterium]
MESYKVIGLMSGSSMDGLDIAYCQIDTDGEQFKYKVLISECPAFPAKWKLRLEKLVLQNAITYIKTHTFFGHFVGEKVKEFIDRHQLRGKIDFIASHGQTVFHQPENLFTSQIGCGAAIAMRTGYPVVCDFRTSDVALGGQGTPIAPAANKYLFSEYKYFLNLGGISNIACNIDGKYVAFDVSAVNLALNKLAGYLGKEYDEDGNIARSGKINEMLLQELNASWYYEKDYPKSLSGGWVSKVMMPVFSRHSIPLEDKLRTTCELIAIQLGNAFKQVQRRENVAISANDRILVTGGGAFNTFLMERIKAHLPLEVVVPDKETVKFKEAVLMALMGVLRVRNQINCFSSVTGASKDSIGGAIYQGTEHYLKTSL